MPPPVHGRGGSLPHGGAGGPRRSYDEGPLPWREGGRNTGQAGCHPPVHICLSYRYVGWGGLGDGAPRPPSPSPFSPPPPLLPLPQAHRQAPQPGVGAPQSHHATRCYSCRRWRAPPSPRPGRHAAPCGRLPGDRGGRSAPGGDPALPHHAGALSTPSLTILPLGSKPLRTGGVQRPLRRDLHLHPTPPRPFPRPQTFPAGWLATAPATRPLASTARHTVAAAATAAAAAAAATAVAAAAAAAAAVNHALVYAAMRGTKWRRCCRRHRSRWRCATIVGGEASAPAASSATRQRRRRRSRRRRATNDSHRCRQSR